MDKEYKITISVNEEDIQNIINAYEKDIEYINQIEKENQELKRKLNETIHKATEFESEVYKLQQENKKYKEVIDKVKELIIDNIGETTYEYIGSNKIKVLLELRMDNDGVNDLLEILKEVE